MAASHGSSASVQLLGLTAAAKSCSLVASELCCKRAVKALRQATGQVHSCWCKGKVLWFVGPDQDPAGANVGGLWEYELHVQLCTLYKAAIH